MDPAEHDDANAPAPADDDAADLEAARAPGRWTGVLTAVGALLVVAGSLVVVLKTLQPAPRTPAPPPQPRVSSIPKLEFSVPNPADAARGESDVDYQCVENGKTVYSNKPCPGGRRMDAIAVEGQGKGSGAPRPAEPDAAPSPEQMETPVSTGPAHLQQCEDLEARIKSNEDAVRQAESGPKKEKDELAAEQRRLQKSRHDLHC